MVLSLLSFGVPELSERNGHRPVGAEV